MNASPTSSPEWEQPDDPLLQPVADSVDRAVLREALAAYAHEAWSGWMTYMLPAINPLLKLGIGQPEAVTQEEFDSAIDHLTRWLRQMQTPYAELSAEEQASDRREADTMLAIMEAHCGTH